MSVLPSYGRYFTSNGYLHALCWFFEKTKSFNFLALSLIVSYEKRGIADFWNKGVIAKVSSVKSKGGGQTKKDTLHIFLLDRQFTGFISLNFRNF